MKNHKRQFPNDDLVLAVQIGVPVALVNIITALTTAARLTAISILKLPLGDWVPILCAIWVVLVLNCGPFELSGSRGKGTRGAS